MPPITIDDFKAIFKRKKKSKMEPPRPGKVDTEGFVIGNELVSVCREATKEGLLLGGRLDQLKSAVEQALDDKDYETARSGLAGIKQYIAEEKTFNQAYAQIKSKLEKATSIGGDLPQGLKSRISEVATARNQITTNRDRGNYAAATNVVNSVKDKLDPLLNDHKEFLADKQQFEIAYGVYGKRATELGDILEDVGKDFDKKLAKVEKSHEAVLAKTKVHDYGAALPLAMTLKEDVEACHTAYKLFLNESKSYYQRLNKVRSRVGEVDKAITAKAYGDPPPESVQKAVETYSNAKKQVVTAQNRKQWEEANGKLDALVKAVQGIEAARLAVLKTEIDGANTAAKVETIVGKMRPNEIAALPVDRQLALLKTLRTAPSLTGTQKEARYTLQNNIPMDEEFVKKDTKNRKKIVSELSQDPKFTEARDKWNDPNWPNSKREEFLKYAAAKQCEIMGHGNPAPTINFTTTRKCRFGDNPKDTPPCPNLRVDISVGGDGKPDKCPSCGAGKRYFYGTLGGCNLDYPATISLNSAPECGMTDMRVILDTVIHENAHAYQMMLLDKLKKGELKEGDPEYNQTRLFQENLPPGYTSNNQANANQAGAYRNQPLEIHAMTMGPGVRDGLLGPEAMDETDLS